LRLQIDDFYPLPLKTMIL